MIVGKFLQVNSFTNINYRWNFDLLNFFKGVTMLLQALFVFTCLLKENSESHSKNALGFA